MGKLVFAPPRRPWEKDPTAAVGPYISPKKLKLTYEKDYVRPESRLEGTSVLWVGTFKTWEAPLDDDPTDLPSEGWPPYTRWMMIQDLAWIVFVSWWRPAR